MKNAAILSLLVTCQTICVGCQQNPPPIQPAPEPDVLVNGDDLHDEDPAEMNDEDLVEEPTNMSISHTAFGKTPEGHEITLFTCTNENGLILKMINYGAIVTEFHAPDRDGNLANINLGFESLDGYLERHPYFGSTVGRYCNRIAKGKFTLNDNEYTLATNNDSNHLHGGEVGFDKVIWQANQFKSEDEVGVFFAYRSKDGEEGYPGNLDVMVTYTLTNNNELSVAFAAKTDKATPINLTNHNYWNLAGAGSGTILEHEIAIAADKFLPVDDTLIPTGELADVAGTPLDFREAKPIGKDLEQIDAEPKGYDHCFVVRQAEGEMRLAARVKDPKTGRVMEIHTTQPGIQFYTGNFLDGSEGNGGFKQHEGFCLETQHYPDSPNQPNFPTTILKPEDAFSQTTVHKFSVE